VASTVFALVSGAARTALPETCCTPVLVADTAMSVPLGEVGYLPWLGVDGLGGVYALWSDDVSGAWLVVSRDNGLTWDSANPIRIGAPGVKYAGADVDADGTVVVAYDEEGTIKAMVSLDQARTFSTSIPLGPGADVPRVRIGPDGAFAVTWLGSAPLAEAAIGASVSLDRGCTWTGPSWLGISASSAVQRTVAIVDGGIAVAWSEDSPGRLFAATSVDGGESWATPTLLAETRFSAFDLGLVASSTGTFCAVTLSVRSDGLWDARSHVSPDRGGSWLRLDPAVRESPTAFTLEDVTATDDGRFLVTWSRPYLGVAELWAPYVGVAWKVLPSAPASVSSTVHGATTASPVPGLFWVVHDDYRDDASCVPICESIYLDQSCDGGATWLADELRLDTDAPPIGTHSEEPIIRIGVGGRIHVLWADYIGGDGQVAHLHHVALDPPPPAASVVVTTEPATECRPSRHVASLEPTSIAWCADPSLQWALDGVPVSGATGPTFEVPWDTAPGRHEVHCLVACADPSTCRNLTDSAWVETEELPTPVRGAELAGTLRVRRTAPGLVLSWGDTSPAATGYNVYSGSIPSLWDERTYDHAGLACHVARVPPTSPTSSLDVPTPAADTYYVVAPADCRAEGSVGRDSHGSTRPLAPAGSACGPMP
jgi:hypothetical protein